MSRLSFALLLIPAIPALADDWPQWMGPTRDDRWNETGILRKFPKGGPKKLWSVAIHGGYSGPAVVAGKVYVTDYESKDAKPANNPGAASKREGQERVVCLDAKTGQEIWKHEYDCPYAVSYSSGPRCTPTVSGGKVYALGAMGNLHVLDAEKGTLIWSKDFKKDYNAKTPTWGFTGHPLIYKNLVVCLVGGDKLLVAFDKDTGKEAWKALTPPGAGRAGYCPPTLVDAGGVKQIVVWQPEKVVSVNADDGKRLWDVPLKTYADMSIMSPRQYDHYLFVGGIGFYCVCLKLDKTKPAVEEVWRGSQIKKNGVYPVNSTPIIDDGIIYAVDQPGVLRGVKLDTGKRLWWTQKPITGKEDEKEEHRVNTGTAFLVKNGDRYFLFSETGDLIIAKLSPKGYEEIDRAKLLETTNECFGRPVVWSHPAFANKCVFAQR